MSFPYGASYSPLMFSREDWERDIHFMQEVGVNLLRVGDVHGSWDRIEPRQGEFRWDILNAFYDVANAHDIQILISTGAASPPLWFAQKYPEARIISSRGERYPLGASYHWACVNHPGFINESNRYLTELCKFVNAKANHFGWQISNEVGFPFLPAREKNELGLYCYCDNCLKVFTEWLKEKYKTTSALTEAWAWGTTNFMFNDWDDVFMPESMPSSWSGVTRWIDWRLFQQYSFTRFIAKQHDLIRGIDKSHPTSVNTFNFKGFDRFGTFSGLDQWSIAENIDHIGYDLYPGSGNKLKTRPEHVSIFLDHGRSVANIKGNDFWLHEVESGPIGGWVLGPDRATDEKDIELYIFDSLGHDAKLLLYMPWREWEYQPLHWGALVDLKGVPTIRMEAAARMGKFIEQNQDFLKHAHPKPAQIAIFESKENAIFFRGVDQEEILFSAQRGAYRAFWGKGFEVDFISSGKFTLSDLNKYKAVCLPLLSLIDEKTSELLNEYVKQGGMVIGFSRSGTLNEKGWYQLSGMENHLMQVFGIKSIEADTVDSHVVNYAGEQFPACMNRDLIAIEPGVKLLATFEDEYPAITMNSYGKGCGLFFATQAEAGAIETGSLLLEKCISDVLPGKDIHPYFLAESENSRLKGIDTHILTSENQTMLLLCNYGKEVSNYALRLSLEKPPIKIEEIYPNKRSITPNIEGRAIRISLKLHEKEVVAFKMEF